MEKGHKPKKWKSGGPFILSGGDSNRGGAQSQKKKERE